MTTHQKYQQRLFTEILHCLACIANGTDIAAGTLRQDLRQLLAEYATADFVIFRCGCEIFDMPTVYAPHVKTSCDTCGKPVERLLSDDTWQSQAARLKEMK